MLKEKIKNQKGIIGADALIAVIIIALFTGIVATLAYNIYLQSTFVKRSVQANEYLIKICEYLDKTTFDKVTTNTTEEGNLISYVNALDISKISAKVKNDTTTLITPYKVEIDVQNYTPQDPPTTVDLTKKVDILLKYNVGTKEVKLNVQRVKAREF